MHDEYESCMLCPRQCGVNRNAGVSGFCGEGGDLRLSAAVIHFGEEPPFTGSGGSGALFFTGCTLRCPFCQNRQISRDGVGRRVSEEEFAGICLELAAEGAENINLITGTQFIPSIKSAVGLAREQGLKLPVLWNSSGFETAEAVDLLESLVDVYLPDVKTLDPGLAGRLFNFPRYTGAAEKAVESMAAQKPLVIEGDAVLSGTVIRHLVLPGFLDSTRQVLRWFKERLYGKALISVMVQYTPLTPDLPLPAGIFPDRKVSEKEYEELLGILQELDIEEGFIQELDEDTAWLPDFSRDNPFPSPESRTVWHWRQKPRFINDLQI